MKKKFIVLVLVLTMIISCAAVFTACDKKDSNLEKITFVLDWAPNTNHTGLYVAQELGYFKDEGFEVSIVQPGKTGTSNQVAANNGTFGIDFQEQMIFNEQANVNVTAIAAIVQHNTSGIISAKVDGIDSADKMTGKKYATWGKPGEQAIVRSMNAGVTMIPKYVENIQAEFENPEGVDCVWSYAAWDKVILDQAGVETNFIWMKDIPNLDYYTPVIIANNDYIKNNPERTKAFMRAVTKGYQYAIDNPHKAGDLLIKRNPELAESKNVIYASLDFLKNEYKNDAPYWGHFEQTRWDNFFALMCTFDDVDENGDRVFPESISKGYGFTNKYLPGYTE